MLFSVQGDSCSVAGAFWTHCSSENSKQSSYKHMSGNPLFSSCG